MRGISTPNGRAGRFAQSLLVVHGLSFTGGAVFLLPVIHDHGRLGPLTGDLFDWSTTTTGVVSIACAAWLLFVASRFRRGRVWRYTAGATLAALASFWGVLILGFGTSGMSAGTDAAFFLFLGLPVLVAGAVVRRRRAGADPAAEDRGQSPPGVVTRALARGADVFVIGMAFAFQTALTDAVGGIGPSGVPSERWVSSARWVGVFLVEVVCATWLGQTPGKAVMGIEVRSARGGRLPLWRSTLRAGLVVSGVFFAWTLNAVTVFRKDRAALHDLAAGSVVVDAGD